MATKFDRFFKENAVKLSYERTTSLGDLAKKIGVTTKNLTKWRHEYLKFGIDSFTGHGKVRADPEKEKVFQLEKILKESKLRFEILKNGSKYLFQGVETSYQFIKKMKKNI